MPELEPFPRQEGAEAGVQYELLQRSQLVEVVVEVVGEVHRHLVALVAAEVAGVQVQKRLASKRVAVVAVVVEGPVPSYHPEVPVVAEVAAAVAAA